MEERVLGSNPRPARSRAVTLLASLAVLVGGIALIGLVRLDPSPWMYRHQSPWWVIGVGALWVVSGLVALRLAGRPRIACVPLLVTALSVPLALVVELDASGEAFWFSDFRWWFTRIPWVLAPLAVAAVVLAAGSGAVLGRRGRIPSRLGVAMGLAVVLWILALPVFAAATFFGGAAIADLAGERDSFLGAFISSLSVAILACLAAGWALGRVGAARAARAAEPVGTPAGRSGAVVTGHRI